MKQISPQIAGIVLVKQVCANILPSPETVQSVSVEQEALFSR